MSTIPDEISGTILNNQTWYVSSTGTYSNKLVKQSTAGTKHYYLGSNLHNDGTDRSANEIYFDTSDNKWHDSGNSNPVSFRVGSVGSETPAESNLPTSETNTGFASDAVSSGDNVIIYRGSSLQQIFSFTQPSGFYSSSGSGGGLTTLSGGTQPEIINVTYTRTSEFDVDLEFDYQNLGNVNVKKILPDGTLVNATITSGGYSTSTAGKGKITYTLAYGDIWWLEHPPSDLYTDLPRYKLEKVKWTINEVSGNLTAKGWFPDNGGNGFGSNFDVGLFGSRHFPHHVDSAFKSTTQEHTLVVQYLPDTFYNVRNIDTTQYGDSYRTHKVPVSKVFRNFW